METVFFSLEKLNIKSLIILFHFNHINFSWHILYDFYPNKQKVMIHSHTKLMSAISFPEQYRSMKLYANESEYVSRMQKIREFTLVVMSNSRAQFDNYNNIHITYSAKKWTCDIMKCAGSIGKYFL